MLSGFGLALHMVYGWFSLFAFVMLVNVFMRLFGLTICLCFCYWLFACFEVFCVYID